MPGKNQQKRIEKTIAHARMVWAREQMAAATFWNAIKDADKIIEEGKAELSDEDYTALKAQVEEQRQYAHDFLVEARDKFVKAVGPENALLDVPLSNSITEDTTQ
jgi:hypothetical protein